MSHSTCKCDYCGFVGCDCHTWFSSSNEEHTFCSESCRDEFEKIMKNYECLKVKPFVPIGLISDIL